MCRREFSFKVWHEHALLQWSRLGAWKHTDVWNWAVHDQEHHQHVVVPEQIHGEMPASEKAPEAGLRASRQEAFPNALERTALSVPPLRDHLQCY